MGNKFRAAMMSVKNSNNRKIQFTNKMVHENMKNNQKKGLKKATKYFDNFIILRLNFFFETRDFPLTSFSQKGDPNIFFWYVFVFRKTPCTKLYLIKLLCFMNF